METFDIANLKVNMQVSCEMLYTRSRAYLTEPTDRPDIALPLTQAFFKQRQQAVPYLSLEECEYIWMGEAFYMQLLQHDGLLMHASCLERGGRAYLFSAKSGTGKSTHTHLWMERFGDCTMVNDDKPAVRRMNGTFYACGTPFSGKNDESTPCNVPIRAIVFLERNAENSITPISAAQAIPLFLSQTLRPPKKEGMMQMLDILGALLEQTPVFLLKCNMESEAAQIAYDGIESVCSARERKEETK